MSSSAPSQQQFADLLARLQAQEDELKALKSHSAADAFAEHLREEGAYKRDAWKADLDNAKAYFEEAAADYRADPDTANTRLQKTFLEQCSAGMLGPMDVMVLTYLFWGSAEGRYNLAAAFLDADTPEKRVQYHNWYLAKDMPMSRLRFVGPAVKELRYPLFPETAVAQEFAVLNRKLLAEVGGNAGGRLFGRGESSSPSVYGGNASQFPAERVVHGAGYRVRVSPDGFVDLKDADAKIESIQADNAYAAIRIEALEAALRNAGLDIPLVQPQSFYQRGGRGRGGRGRGGRGGPNH